MKNKNLIPSLLDDTQLPLPKRGGRYVSLAEKERKQLEETEAARRESENEARELRRKLYNCNCDCDCDCHSCDC